MEFASNGEDLQALSFLVWGILLHAFCFNGRIIDAMGAHQEGFLEEVMSKL